MNKALPAILFLLAIVVGGYFLLSGKESSKTEVASPQQNPPEEIVNRSNENPSLQTQEPINTNPGNQGEVKEFFVSGVNFSFSLNEMRVSKGDTVRITFKNEEGIHDWKIDEFGAATKVIQAGQEETIEFVVDKVGEFEYYCSVGNHRELGMRGKLIVE